MNGLPYREAYLDRVRSCICRDRQNAYNDAEDNFTDIAAYWTLWLRQRKLLVDSSSLDPLDVAMMSGMIKIARAAFNPLYLDNWDDLGGYAGCGAGIAQARNEANQT